MSPDPYPLFSVFAFIGFVVGLVPLPWHLQALNAGTCMYMFWASFASLIEFVDSVVWHGSTANVAPIYCDISTKFLIGAGVGIPAASLCINRRLYKIASIKAVSITHEDRRRAIFVDMAIALGLPVLVMILHVVVQGHRFNIVEDVGCVPTIYNTPPAYPLVFMWPVLIGCISFCYAFLTLRAFWRRRIEFNTILSSNTSLTASRYFRLMLLSCTEMACTVPLGAYSIYANIGGVPIARWTGWADVHFNFGFVQEIPASIWKNNHRFVVATEMGRWIYPCSAMLFFALFGFADEARRNYARAFRAIVRVCGIKPRSAKSNKGGAYIAPLPPKIERTVISDAEEPLPLYSSAPMTQRTSTTLTEVDLEKGGIFTPSSSMTFMGEKHEPFAMTLPSEEQRRTSGSIVVYLPSSPTHSESSSSTAPSTASCISPSSHYHDHSFRTP